MSGTDEFRLLVLRGVEGRREYVLKGDLLELGRPEPGWSPAIPIIAEGVLARHATLRREGDGYRLDPAPGATVTVNRRPFAGGPLRDGDVLTLGVARFQFWAGGLHGRAPETPGATLSPSEATSGHGALPSGGPVTATSHPARRRLLLLLLILAGILLLLVLLRSAALGPRP